MRFGLILSFASALTLTACLPPHPPPAPAPPEVLPQSAIVPLGRLPAAAVAHYLGTFHNGGGTLTIGRSGGSLTVQYGGAAAMPLALVGLGTFTDAGGTAYLFIPADGSGVLRAVAANGTSRDWMR